MTAVVPGGLFLQALIAFLALPGMVAFVGPLAFLVSGDHARSFDPLAAIPLATGVLGLLWCVREFYVAGKGTLAPWAPPQHLVVTGLYKYSRNPMYVAVLVILGAWAFGFRSRSLEIYALVAAVVFHLRVVVFEEPWLSRVHGERWTAYKRRVPRWMLWKA